MPACTECGSTFVRQEHLTRHRAAIHDRSTCFTCDNCYRTFTRSDSFRRHCRSHHCTRPVRWRVAALSSHPQAQCACQACIRLGAKCSGGVPCTRCIARGLSCHPHPYAPNAAANSIPDDGEAMPDVNAQLSPALPSPVPGSLAPSPPVEPCLTRAPNQQLLAPFCPTERTPFLGFFGLSSAPTFPTSVGIDVPSVTLETVDGFLYDAFDSLSNGRNWLPPQNPAVLNSILTDPSVSCQITTAHDSMSPCNHALPDHSIASTYTMAVGGTEESGPQAPPAFSHSGHSGHSAASERSGDSPCTSLYADGKGFRGSYLRHPALPRLRPEGSTLISRHIPPAASDMVFEFTASSESTESDISPSLNSVELASSTYMELRHMFEILAGRDSLLYSAFGSNIFPSLPFIQDCLNLFVVGPSHDIPVVHVSTWHKAQMPWLLTLAVAAVGSLYHPITIKNQVSSAFQELTRRSIRYTIEKLPLTKTSVLRQACLLNACLAGQVWESSSLSIQDALTDLMLADQRSSHTEQSCQKLSPFSDAALQDWTTWVSQETSRRLDYFSWQTRFLTSITTPRESHDEGDVYTLPLPCSQALWDLVTAEKFQEKLKTYAQVPTIHDALQSLYLKRRIPSSCKGRELIPLIYGVVHRTCEVGQQLLQPLKQWMPVSRPQTYAKCETIHVHATWLPANATYAAWRNSGCDCLDLLHWQTHVESASAVGLEGPQVLHLHLARLLLLTPFREMISFARSFSSSPMGTSRNPILPFHLSNVSSESSAKNAIMRWITLDDYKGRLSLIHAGAIFWHIRRYARGNFYEPFAVFLATLILWLYANYEPQLKATILANKATVSRYQETLGQHTDQNQETITEGNLHANDRLLPIALDRPCDDEIVQLFIREGHLMDPTMFRAVRICSVEGSRKVLDEGIKLLSRCQCNSVVKAGEYADVLVNLVAAVDAA